MSETQWELPRLEVYDDIYTEEWDVVLDAWNEEPHGTIDVAEYRPSQIDDINFAPLARTVWGWLQEDLPYYGNLSWTEGRPVLEPLHEDGEQQLEHVLRELIVTHLDLSEAAWQPTERVRRIAPDGTWTEVEP